MAEKPKKYKCLICGQIVEPNEDGTCPICGAGEDMLVPVDDDGNEIPQ
jgi:rubrerythrin